MSDPVERPSLPRELLANATWREVFWVTVPPLCVVWLVNLALALTLQAFPNNRGDWLVRAKWQLLLDQKHAADTLVLGDSTCNQGIDPSELSRVLGGRTLNLCTTGDKLAVMDAWLLQAYVKRFGAPKRVLVMHAYDVWKRDEGVLRKVAWTFSPYRKLFAESHPQIDWNVRESILLRIGLWVPLYNQPQASLEVLRAPREAVQRKPYVITPEGFMAYKRANPKRVAREVQSYLRALERDPPPMSDANRAALRVLIDTVRGTDTQLIVAHAPIFEGLWSNAGVRRYHKAVSQALERELRKAPNARLLSRKPHAFPANEMQSPDHLVGDASVRFTQAIASQIATDEPPQD